MWVRGWRLPGSRWSHLRIHAGCLEARGGENRNDTQSWPQCIMGTWSTPPGAHRDGALWLISAAVGGGATFQAPPSPCPALGCPANSNSWASPPPPPAPKLPFLSLVSQQQRSPSSALLRLCQAWPCSHLSLVAPPTQAPTPFQAPLPREPRLGLGPFCLADSQESFSLPFQGNLPSKGPSHTPVSVPWASASLSSDLAATTPLPKFHIPGGFWGMKGNWDSCPQSWDRNTGAK